MKSHGIGGEHGAVSVVSNDDETVSFQMVDFRVGTSAVLRVFRADAVGMLRGALDMLLEPEAAPVLPPPNPGPVPKRKPKRAKR